MATGTVFIEVIRQVLRNDHDLVIKSPESTDSYHYYSGEDKQLLRKCPCAIWMIRLSKGQTFKRIMAAIDVDDNHPTDQHHTRQALNNEIMKLAGSLAVSEFAELTIASVWQASAEGAIRFAPFIQRPAAEADAYVEKVRNHYQDLLQKQLDQLTTELGSEAVDYIKPQLHCVKGTARKNIPELAEQLDIDCIVMGTVGRVGLPGFFIGNTAESILEQLSCSVLAIKPEGFITPVVL